MPLPLLERERPTAPAWLPRAGRGAAVVNDLPPLARERARMVIASTIASAAMGADIVSSQIIRALAKERGGAEQATISM